MKKLFSAIIIAAAMASPAAAQNGGGSLTVKGSINGHEGEYISLFTTGEKGSEQDSARITGGRFSFSKTLAAPMEVGTLVIGDPHDYQTAKMCYLYMEPGTMTVRLDKDDFRHPAVTGSLTQAQADSVEAERNEIMAGAARIQAEMDTCQDRLRHAELMDMLEPYQKMVMAAEIEWVKARPGSYYSPMMMRFLMGDMAYNDIKSVYESFTPAVKAMPDCKEITAELATLARVQPGEPAPLFRAKSWKGTDEGLADLKGKYVLLDFWATWCVPCRKSFPHVKALYEKYNAKGLDVFCVADDDGNEARWKAAIEKDGVQKFHHVLRGLKWNRSKGLDGMDKTNDISEKYAIHYLPTKYLIDKEGLIIGKFADEELDAKLKEIFGF